MSQPCELQPIIGLRVQAAFFIEGPHNRHLILARCLEEDGRQSGLWKVGVYLEPPSGGEPMVSGAQVFGSVRDAAKAYLKRCARAHGISESW